MKSLVRTFCILAGSLALLYCESPRAVRASTHGAEGEILRLQEEARGKKLSEHPYWRKLLHYGSANLGFSWESRIISPEFFLSPQGRENPRAELQATIAAMFREFPDDPNKHPQCLFIGRFHWLKEQLDFSKAALPSPSCENFLTWSRIDEVESVSLIFVNGLFGNPASLFGHILFKLNHSGEGSGAKMFDQSSNYGALIPPGTNGLFYVIRGLFGGFDAAFSENLFFQLHQVYGENELRDLWEYELNFTKPQQRRIIYHLWELLQVRFQYYFLKENCAYRMAELIALALPGEITSQIVLWQLPVDVFHRMQETTINGGPLLRKFTYIPSRQIRLKQAMQRLTEGQREIVVEIAEDFSKLEFLGASPHDEEGQTRIVNALLHYYQFRIVNSDDKAGKSEFNKKKFRALQLRSQLPVLEPIPPNPEERTMPPTQGSPPANIQLGYRWNGLLGDGVELGYRAAYHDLLGRGAGHLPNSGLAVFDIRFWQAGERIKLQRFDVFRAESLNLNETGLPGDGGLAWRLVLGAERAHRGCVDCLYGHLTGGLGKAAYLGTERIVGYALAQPSLISHNEFTGSAGISAILGLTVRFSDGWMTRLEGGYGMYLDSLGNGSFFTFENRFGSAPSWDVRLTVEREVETETALGLVFYW